MKRNSLPIWLSVLALVVLSPQGSFAQTATPTPTATPVVPTPTITPTRAPVFKIGAIQGNAAEGLPFLASDGTPVLNLTATGTNFLQSVGIGSAPASAYRLYSLIAGTSGPDYAVGGNNISTEASTQVGVFGWSHGPAAATRVGLWGAASDSTTSNTGIYAPVGGSVGPSVGISSANSNTSDSTQYGIQSLVTGVNAASTHVGLSITASGGGTNWDLYTNGTQSRIAGMLQLTDSAQQITVNTTNNTVQFGNGTTADNASVDCDDGTISLAGKLNLRAGSALTIAAGAVTITKSRHSLTASGASDTLNTINGYVSGDVLYLCGTSGKTITVADGAGNIQCGSNRSLTDGADWITLLYDGSAWQMTALSLDN